jgi:hypothetical protein
MNRRFLLGAWLLLAGLVCLAANAQVPMTGAGKGAPGGGGGGSFTTLDPSNTGAGGTLSGGNLTLTWASAGASSRSIASHTTGKYYAEFTFGPSASAANTAFGILNAAKGVTSVLGTDNNAVGVPVGDSCLYLNGSCLATSNAPATGSTNSLAVDVGAQLIWFAAGGCSAWSSNAGPGFGDPATGANGASFAALTGAVFAGVHVETNSNSIVTANFGATSYACTPPSGFGNW